MAPDNVEYCVRKSKADPYKRLPPEVFDLIAGAIKVEKDLLEVGPGSLEMSYDQGYAVVALLGEEPVGYTRLQVLIASDGGMEPWLELGSTWVREEHRSKGINKEMYRLLLPMHKEKNILATTTNLSSIAVGEAFNFVPVHRKALPRQIWLASCCCPIAKTMASQRDNSDCSLARGEPQKAKGVNGCWFRVTPETAARLNLESCAA